MGLYWKTAAGAMLAVVMILMLRRHEIGALLAVVACVMVAMAAAEYLRPVLELVVSLEEQLDGELITVLLKAVGIGIVTEISCMVCTDSGNSSLGKAMQLLGSAVILWLSVPLFTSLLELIRQILEGL